MGEVSKAIQQDEALNLRYHAAKMMMRNRIAQHRMVVAGRVYRINGVVCIQTHGVAVEAAC